MNLAFSERIILVYVICSPDCQYDNGSIRFLCNFEHPIMERKEFRICAACTFRVNTNGNLIRFDQLDCLMNCFDGITGIIPVDGQKAASSDQPSENGNVEIFRLGYKRNIFISQNMPCDDGIKFGTVVADKKHLFAIRYFFQTGSMNFQPTQSDSDDGSPIQKPPVKATVVFIVFLWVYQQSSHPKKQ